MISDKSQMRFFISGSFTLKWQAISKKSLQKINLNDQTKFSVYTFNVKT